MTKPRDPDALLSAYLADGMEVLPDRVVDSVLDEIHRTRQRAVFGSRRTRSMFKPSLAAAAVVAVLVSGTLLMTRPDQPAIGDASPTPTLRPSQSHTADPTVRPSPSTALMIWSPTSLEEDWPAPVRSEPVGGGAIVQNGAPSTYPDPVGDVDASVPWIDIRDLRIYPTTFFIGFAVNVPPVVDPTEQWIAYGVVWDTDRDGVPDVRFGVDNPGGEEGRRAWITDLQTGQTVWTRGGEFVHVTFYDGYFDPSWPSDEMEGARFKFGGDTTGPGPGGGGIVGGLTSPLYAWASVIQNGRVIATDYAPDAGWLDPSAKAKP